MRGLRGASAAMAIAALLTVTTATPRAEAQAAPAAGSAVAAKPHKAARTRAFDGVWSVSIATVSGSCPAGARYSARIYNGQVLRADDEYTFEVNGAVNGAGGIVVRVSAAGQSAIGHGRMTRTQGAGTWHTLPVASAGCTGTWSATRRS
jgi:hypothetical protein